MPAKTAKQKRAMFSAAAGKSTIGIPKSVGKEFIGHKNKKAALLDGYKKGKRQ